MNKYFVKIAVVLFLVAFAMSACDKEEPDISTVRSDVSTAPVVMEGYVRQPIEINGKKMEWTIPARQKSLSKGIVADEAGLYSEIEWTFGPGYKLIDTVSFVYNNINYSMKVLRVDRKSEPGKYFYVMIDNLNVALDTACWAYADNVSNVSTYGRLYTWPAANALATQISMQLPVYSATNPTQQISGVPAQLVQAQILSQQDVCDIIECDTIGHMPEYGYSVICNLSSAPGHGILNMPLFYYDVFVGGLAWSGHIDYTLGHHTLGGFRNTIQQDPMYWEYWVNGWYTGINTKAFIWLRDRSGSETHPFHYPLVIEYNNNYNYSAYVNAGHWDKYGYSVRYIFEPVYQ